MWDYYNGLVRVHDFFDCCKPGKVSIARYMQLRGYLSLSTDNNPHQTEPGNAVKEKINPGLQSICHNITGGNLHAQGKSIAFIPTTRHFHGRALSLLRELHLFFNGK